MTTATASTPSTPSDRPSDLPAELTAAMPVEPAHLAALRNRLAEDAASRGVLDVAYATWQSPVGELLLAATGAGLVRIAFADQDHDRVLRDLALRISPRVLRAPRRLDDVVSQLEEYFAGARRGFEVTLDWRLSSGFRLGVLEHLVEIPYGETESYARVAVAAGSPRAVRAVGTACAGNPLPIVVPCHRVVRSDGSHGGYAGGTQAKRLLLALEAGGVARLRG
jgi:methylated-DNA-[protein]-cysteine S-methyltransferase